MKSKTETMKDLARVRRHQIIIQRKVDRLDGVIGNSVETWSNWKVIKTEKTNLWGKEYYAAATVGEEQTTVFVIPYAPFINIINTVEFRLVFKGRIYDIKHIDYLPGETWVKIKAIIRRRQ